MLSSLRLKAIRILGIAMIAIATASCGIRFKEDLPGQEPIKLKGANSGCLTGSSQVIEKYLEGKAEDASIAGVFDCAIESLSRFADQTRGSKRDTYSQEELKRFLEKYFLKDTSISEGLLEETMELKRALLGGSLDQLTETEIQKLQTILRILRHHSLQLNRFMPLGRARFEKLPPSELSQLSKMLKEAANDLGSQLDSTGSPYRFQNLENLALEAHRFYKGPVSLKILRDWQRRFQLMRRAKTVFVGPGSERVAGNEWAAALSSFSGWIAVSAKAIYLSQSRANVFQGSRRETFSSLMRETIELFEGAVSRHPNGKIPFDDFDALVDAYGEESLKADFGISADHLKQFFRPLFRNVLGGASQGGDGRTADGLSVQAVRRAKAQLEKWASAQELIEKFFHVLSGPRVFELNGYVSALRADLLGVRAELVTGKGVSALTQAEREGISLVYQLIKKHPALFGDSVAEFEFDVAFEKRYTFYHLSMLNWLFHATELLWTGYMGSDSLSKPEPGYFQPVAAPGSQQKLALTVHAFDRLYRDFRPLGVELNIFDPDRYDVAFNRFSDGNLFTSIANGDDYLDIDEAVELFGMMLSGKMSGARTHLRIAEECGVASGPERENDKFGQPMIEARCYREKYFSKLEESWLRMPGLLSFFQGMSSQEQNELAHAYENICRYGGASENKVDSADSEAAAMLAHYMEMTFARFDKDRSGTISRQESDAIFPVVRKVMDDTAKALNDGESLSEGQLQALHSYFLKYGHAPKGGLKGKSHFIQWMMRKPFWSFEADRSRILEVFHAFKKQPAQ